MTDDRIAELLGWPRGRTNRDSSLMHRIRIFVAEAQAEQDGHIRQLQDQIERMRAALVEAREIISDDRESIDACTRWPDGSREPADTHALAYFDALLEKIDAALGDDQC